VGVLVLARADPEEGGEERELSPVGGLEVGVEVPPLRRGRSVGQIMDLEVD
jgi:hypothetical protein